MADCTNLQCLRKQDTPASCTKIHVSILLLRHKHECCVNAGKVLNCKGQLSTLCSEDVVCRRARGKAGEQKMADLLLERILLAPPSFTNVGLDYFGLIKVKWGRITIKRNGVIFTYLVELFILKLLFHLTHAFMLWGDLSAGRAKLSTSGLIMEPTWGVRMWSSRRHSCHWMGGKSEIPCSLMESNAPTASHRVWWRSLGKAHKICLRGSELHSPSAVHRRWRPLNVALRGGGHPEEPSSLHSVLRPTRPWATDSK